MPAGKNMLPLIPSNKTRHVYPWIRNKQRRLFEKAFTRLRLGHIHFLSQEETPMCEISVINITTYHIYDRMSAMLESATSKRTPTGSTGDNPTTLSKLQSFLCVYDLLKLL